MVKDPVILRGLSADGFLKAPLILKRTDQEFIPAILEELSRPGGLAEIHTTKADERDAANGSLKLFQPVHRTFHVALLHVSCDTFGRPRLDPERIESAGLVIRRIRGSQLQGWKKQGPVLHGWMSFDNTAHEDLDPDPKRRPAALRAGHPEINRHLADLHHGPEPYSESTSPLFVAPPEVCKTSKRTILYGVIPLTSFEFSERDRSPSLYSETTDTEGKTRSAADKLAFDNKLSSHLSGYLTQEGIQTLSFANETFQYSAVVPDPDDPKPSRLDQDEGFRNFVAMLRQLAIEFDAFGRSPESLALFRELNTILLPFPGQRTTDLFFDTFTQTEKKPAGEFLKQAVKVLVELEPDEAVTMPMWWPGISPDQKQRIFALTKAALKVRADAVAPREGRFENLAGGYRLRAFVRVKQPDGCPPVIVWSEDYSEPFIIAPWYDNGAMPPVQVALPDITRDFLKNLKPNVAFSVPKGLFDILNTNDPKKLAKGEGKEGKGFDLDWICSFSIPIITLCAFIVLNIFLQLFDIIFRWLLYIKICIPIPRKS